VRVGGNIKAPTRIKDVAAIYPEEAQAARVSGFVMLELTIGIDGRVVDRRVLRSTPMLDQAALDAASQWEFTPTYLNGEPVPVIMTATLNFTPF
jgi:protein TonB